MGSAWQILYTVMADDVVCTEATVTNPFSFDSRPIYRAFLSKKIPCPHVFCAENASFYEESGIQHHWSVIHNKKCTTDNLGDARKLMMKRHGEETLRCLNELFRIRSTQVCVLESMSTEYE